MAHFLDKIVPNLLLASDKASLDKLLDLIPKDYTGRYRS